MMTAHSEFLPVTIHRNKFNCPYYRYRWNESFHPADLIQEISSVNAREQQVLEQNLETDSSHNRPEQPTRIAHADSVVSALDPSNDMTIPVWLPAPFAQYANDLIQKSLQAVGLADATRLPTLIAATLPPLEGSDLRLHFWRIDSVIMWQQLNRRIDE
jgi:hypothetical protein